MIEKIRHIDPSKLTDNPEVQKVLTLFMNILEEQSVKIATQAKEIQELKDEINRMKGEHGSPTAKPKVSHATGQKPKIRPTRKSRNKGGKKDKIIIDKVVNCSIDKSILPTDAKLHHYKDLIQQDIIFKRTNTLFKVPVYYSEKEGRTYAGRLSALLKNMGVLISDGQISNVLLSNTAAMQEEVLEILHAGLTCIDYAQMDATKSFEAGKTKATQIICTPYYSVYQTMDNKSRCSVIGALQGIAPAEIPLLYNDKAVELLQASKVPKKDQRLLAQLLELEQTYTITDFESLLAKQAPHLLAKASHAKVLAILSWTYYQVQEDFPIATQLLTDAGHEYDSIVPNQLLCWIHEERHFKKMVPKLSLYQNLLEKVRGQIWVYYKKLLNFKELDSIQQKQQRKKLVQEFDHIFTQTTAYEHLNKRLTQTFSRKQKLLSVLDFPQVPLHNNAAELAVRRKVRKRDISLHTMSIKGTQAQDAFMSVVETAIKLGVNAFDYLLDRLTHKNQMTSLADLIKLKTN